MLTGTAMSVIKNDWNYAFDYEFEETEYRDLEINMQRLHSRMMKTIDVFMNHKLSLIGNFSENRENDIRNLVERNKQLRLEFESKLDEISSHQSQYVNYKQDLKLLSQEIKERHEAFLTAKKYYKKILKIYYTIESKTDEQQIIYIQFFTEAKKDVDNYSIRLSRQIKTAQYQILNTVPQLDYIQALQRKLCETKDVFGALCCIRHGFMSIRIKK